MRKSILPLVLLAAFGTAGVAFAEDTAGVIKSINQATKTVTLEDGSVYSFDGNSERHSMLGGLRAGDKVNVFWSTAGGNRVGESISPLGGGNSTVGVIKAVDHAAMSVTLDNGDVYKFGDNSDHRGMLGGLKAGDRAHVRWSDAGGVRMGESISPAGASTDATGVIKAIDHASMTVALENGDVYRFNKSENHRRELAGLNPGNKVQIVWSEVGGHRMGEMISATE